MSEPVGEHISSPSILKIADTHSHHLEREQTQTVLRVSPEELKAQSDYVLQITQLKSTLSIS